MTTDYRALCAELLAVSDSYDDESNLVGIFDDMKANKNDLLDRARAALAEPVPPDEGEVAELVAWLWSMHELAGEHNPEEQCRYARTADLLERLAPEPVPARPTVMEIIELSSELDGSGDVSLVRAALARWGTPNLEQVRSSLGDGSAVPEGPSDEELTLTYAYAVAAAVDNKRGPFKNEDVEAAQLAGLRAVLARWGQTPNA